MTERFNNTEALKTALDTYLDLLANSISSDEEAAATPAFSDSFERRMDRLFRRERRFYFYWINTAAKRVACILILLFLAAVTTTFSAEALRESFIRFIINTFKEGTTISTINQPSANESLIPQLPAYLPHDLSLVTDSSDEISVIRLYETPDKNYNLYFMQQPINEFSVTINTEGVAYQKIIIAEKYEGIITNNAGINILTFSTPDYGFLINTNLPQEELLKIAESIPFDLLS